MEDPYAKFMNDSPTAASEGSSDPYAKFMNDTSIAPVSVVDPYTKFMSSQNSILPNPEPITQRFGNINPSVEVFSKGKALGTNIAADVGTPVALPPGNWQVESTFTGAKSGYIGNGINQGYGNDVKARNTDTGEILHFTHLSNVGVMPGQIINGGSIIGQTGATGNVTGPHLNLEYYDQKGNLGDVLNSHYGQYIQTQ